MSTMNSLTGGANPTPSPCLQTTGVASLERARYFARQLLTADDLTADQQHVLAKFRRHNRYLHGWGVVCGGRVCAVPTQKWMVVVEPAYLLSPQGDEILIDDCVKVDLSRQGLDGNAASPCVEPVDPWCSSVRVDLRIGQRLFIAAAYSECLTRPVRVQPAGCRCDDASCEYSRLRDGYVIRVLTSLPDSYAQMKPPVDPRLCLPGGVRPCPDCIADPWVLLAAITIRGSVISDNDIDNVTYRRHVISFADDYVLCGPKLIALVLDPAAVIAGNPSTGTVTLDRPAPQGDSYILLSNSDPTSATVPDSVTVPATHKSQQFPVTTNAAGPGGTVTISATLLADKKSAPLQILTLQSLEIDPPATQVGAPNVIGKVTLSAPAPSGLTVSVTVNNSSVAVPQQSSVPFTAGSISATFPITIIGAGLATFTATLDGIQKSATLSTYSLISVSVGDGKALAGQTVQGTITLAGAVPSGGVSITLQGATISVINPSPPAGVAVADVLSSTVPVPGGNNPTGTFSVRANLGGVAKFTATLGGQEVSGNLSVVSIKTFVIQPATIFPGSTDNSSATGTVTLSDNAPGVDAQVATTVSQNNQVLTGVLNMPSPVTVSSGTNLKSFTITATNTFNSYVNPPLTITATLGRDSYSAPLSVEGAPR
jgi:hypothetical protein